MQWNDKKNQNTFLWRRKFIRNNFLFENVRLSFRNHCKNIFERWNQNLFGLFFAFNEKKNLVDFCYLPVLFVRVFVFFSYQIYIKVRKRNTLKNFENVSKFGCLILGWNRKWLKVFFAATNYKTPETVISYAELDYDEQEIVLERNSDEIICRFFSTSMGNGKKFRK